MIDPHELQEVTQTRLVGDTMQTIDLNAKIPSLALLHIKLNWIINIHLLSIP